MQKRFRKAGSDHAAEVWAELGLLRFRLELYENGEFVQRAGGAIPRGEYTECLLSGRDVAALVRVHPGREVTCTWAR